MFSTLLGLIASIPRVSADAQFWSVKNGQSVIALDKETLAKVGLTVSPVNTGADGTFSLNVGAETPYVACDDLTSGHFIALQVFHRDGLLFSTNNGQFTMSSALVDATAGALEQGATDGSPRLLVFGGDRVMDVPSMTFLIDGASLLMSSSLAGQLGRSELAGTTIGTLTMQLNLESPKPTHEPSPLLVCSPANSGPDVIVGQLEQGGGGGTVANYNVVGSIDAFSYATYSCNLGNVDVNWISSNNQHPEIGGAMYRYKVVNGAGRMEQIGIGWLKHGFTALADSICCTCNGHSGSVLGQGCADPYTASRNGTQVTSVGGLGPRFQTNAHTGVFTYPYMFQNQALPNGGETNITRRVQVQTSDLDPAQNSGASYYAEAQYVTADDAAAGNQNNNASYIPITIAAGTASQGYNGSASPGTTVRSKAAIQRWKVIDSSVTETLLDVPENGGTATARLILSAKATSLGGGIYHYEYALYNMNSDRCVQAFNVPVDPGVTVTNIGFHDVFYHSFDGCGTSSSTPITYDGTDWPGTVSGGAVHWDMVALNGTGAQANCNSNALRFGSTYNFRFDANVASTTGNATITQWKVVNNVSASTVIPSVPACTAPVIDPIHNGSVACGTSYTSSTPSLTSGTAPVTWSLGAGAPAGMTINPSTGVVSWTTPVTTGSPYTITTTATNSCGSNSMNWTLTVNGNPPSVANISNDSATCGAAYSSAAPSASGGIAPLTWSLVTGPQGMTINSSTGAVSWPNADPAASPYTITVSASSAGGCGSDSKSWQLTVNANPPSVANISDDSATCGVSYASAAPTASGGVAPLTWSLVTGPAGMTIDSSTGAVSWSNADPAGSPYTITVRASSAGGCGSDSKSWQLTVGSQNAPTIDAIADAFATVGAPYTSPAPTTTGGAAPFTWSLLAGPPELTIDTSTGAVTWPNPVPTAPFVVTVQAASAYNCGASSLQTWHLGAVVGDFNGDGQVTDGDIPGFVDNMLLDSPASGGDLNGDGVVDGNDIAALIESLNVQP